MKRMILIITIPAMLASALTACDGDDSLNMPPAAKLATTNEVAFLFAAYQITRKAPEYGFDFHNRATQPTPVCDNGPTGTVSFKPNTTTPDSNDGEAVFSQCLVGVGTRDEVATGRTTLKCGAGDTQCNTASIEFSDSVNGARTFDFDTTDSTSSPPLDASWKVKGVFPYGPNMYKDQEGTITFTDNINRYAIPNFGIAVVFDHVDRSKTEGRFGVISTPNDCPSGSVSASSDPADPRTITLTGSDGKQATVVANINGSAVVTLADGTTRTYSAGVMSYPQQLCANAALP
ncbi:hypothetical protein [Stenotrophobium rhamnosiphilum]|uniref:Lipoprotein n=1 Tax=Stenotrophobium rhamnosiphilum TaxID=2029166 RepID=A0A2T5MJR8_9GAMM|nr:hypothetical protein [Stenotrophobium rhamnosiphilum]PTU32822.1 hypothetical protein CJD38_01535 [Stenotrophobium rhamnosiphilum]